MATIDTETPMPQHDTNAYQNKVIPMTEKTEQPPPQSSLMTPPMSPINTSPNRGSLKITAGQTGLPWLTRDADAEGFSPTSAMQQSPQEMSATPSSTQDSINSAASPPPKFMARPRTASVIRFPTRKRTMQKHIYTMKDGLDPVKVLCNRLSSWQVSVKYLVCKNATHIKGEPISELAFSLACFIASKRSSPVLEKATERSIQNPPSPPRSKTSSNLPMAFKMLGLPLDSTRERIA